MRNGKDTATWILPRRAGEGDRVAVEGARGAPCPLRLARSVLATSPASQGRSLKTYLPQRGEDGAQRRVGGHTSNISLSPRGGEGKGEGAMYPQSRYRKSLPPARHKFHTAPRTSITPSPQPSPPRGRGRIPGILHTNICVTGGPQQ